MQSVLLFSSSVSGKVWWLFWVSFQPHLFLFPQWQHLVTGDAVYIWHTLRKKQWSAALQMRWRDEETSNWKHYRMLLNVNLIFIRFMRLLLSCWALYCATVQFSSVDGKYKWTSHQSHTEADTVIPLLYNATTLHSLDWTGLDCSLLLRFCVQPLCTSI